jgi:hypothetical protein
VALFAALGFLLAILSRSPGVLLVVWFLLLTAVILGLAGFVVVGVGAFRCTALPPSRGGTGLAQAAAICSVIPGVNLVGWVLFLVVLRSMAVHLRDKRLASRILTFLVCMVSSPVVLGFCCVGLFFASAFLAAVQTEGGPVPAFFPVFFYGTGLILSLWFASLVREVRARISRSPIVDEEEEEEDEDD